MKKLLSLQNNHYCLLIYSHCIKIYELLVGTIEKLHLSHSLQWRFVLVFVYFPVVINYVNIKAMY